MLQEYFLQEKALLCFPVPFSTVSIQLAHQDNNNPTYAFAKDLDTIAKWLG
mgnify:CR=1 FL=1